MVSASQLAPRSYLAVHIAAPCGNRDGSRRMKR
jgi:hypothetical protein